MANHRSQTPAAATLAKRGLAERPREGTVKSRWASTTALAAPVTKMTDESEVVAWQRGVHGELVRGRHRDLEQAACRLGADAEVACRQSYHWPENETRPRPIASMTERAGALTDAAGTRLLMGQTGRAAAAAARRLRWRCRRGGRS